MSALAITTVDLARIQFATTSLYHFLFVPLTLGLAPLVAVMQTLWHRTGDEAWLRLTRFFGTLLLINFAIGVATGLVQEFQFGMNWSVYSKYVGDVFGAPLAIEGLGRVLPRGDVPRALDLRLEPALAAGAPGDDLARRRSGRGSRRTSSSSRTRGCSTRSGTRSSNGKAELTSVWALLTSSSRSGRSSTRCSSG